MSITVKRTQSIRKLAAKLQEDNGKFFVIGIKKGDKELAQIMRWLEYGWTQTVTPNQANYFRGTWGIPLSVGGTLHLPPRPFFRQTIAENKAKWKRELAKAYKETKSANKALEIVAKIAREDIRESIRNGGTKGGSFAPLSEATKKIYQKEGKPIDRLFGERAEDMAQMIDYEIGKRR